MPNISLTQLGAERLRPADTDIIYWDKNLPGFGLRVSTKGRKSFIAQYRFKQPDGRLKERQEVLGTLAFMTVAQARDKAREAKLKAAGGVDPVGERRVAKAKAEAERIASQFTLAKLVDKYTAEYVTPNLKPGGATVKMYLLRRWTRAFGDSQADQITEADILRYKNELLKDRSDGRAQMDHMIRALSRVYQWGIARRLVTVNPAKDIAKDYRLVSRERVLSHAEIKKLWDACEQVGWPSGPIFQLLLLTGQREMEIGGMRWSELDLDKRQLNLPGSRTKNGKAHTVHLSDLALEIIEAQKRIAGGDYVFSTTGKGPFQSYTPARKRLQRLMGDDVPDFVTHDLRRTATTLMAELGIAPHVADKVLNHTGGTITGVAAVYNRFAYLEERKAALDAVSRFIATLIGRDQGNVVPLRQAAAE